MSPAQAGSKELAVETRDRPTGVSGAFIRMEEKGNIAEVEELRSHLLVPEYVQVFSDLLDSTSDGIEVSYNAAGVLVHLASDGKDIWMIAEPTRSHVLHRIVKAINRWDISSRRNINYRSFQPILRLLTMFETPEVQHWAVWALCNLTAFCPEKYCSLLEEENGVHLLEQVLADHRPYHVIHCLARCVLKQMNMRMSLTEGLEQLCPTESAADKQDELVGGQEAEEEGNMHGAVGGVQDKRTDQHSWNYHLERDERNVGYMDSDDDISL